MPPYLGNRTLGGRKRCRVGAWREGFWWKRLGWQRAGFWRERFGRQRRQRAGGWREGFGRQRRQRAGGWWKGNGRQGRLFDNNDGGSEIWTGFRKQPERFQRLEIEAARLRDAA